MKKRNANIELLRILAMFLVLTLHYHEKGGALFSLGSEEYMPINTTLAWTFEALARPCTNLFVLIFGYFGTKSEFKMEKVVKLWIQVFTYSAGIFVLFAALGFINLSDYKDIYKLAYYFLPITSRHYWFITFYLMLYLISPFINVAIKNMSKKMHLTLIIVSVIIFSKLIPTFILTTYLFDDQGCGIVWFVIMYLIGAYVALYVPEYRLGKTILCLLTYLVGTAIMVANIFIFHYVDARFGILSSWSGGAYKNNGLIVTISSVALLLFFRNLKIENKIIGGVIRFAGPLTFGIYLLHEQELIKGFWQNILRVPDYIDKPYYPLHFLASVIIVFVVCAAVEWIRVNLTGLIYRLPPCKWVFKQINKVNKYFNN